MPRFDALAALDLTVTDCTLARRTRQTTSGFERVTTTVELAGDGATGRGEDVTYDAALHDSLHDRGPWDLAGEYTFAEFSAALDDVALFADPPDAERYEDYRRWAVESAALDLALRQADATLGDVLDVTPTNPNFVVSTSLEDQPDRVDRLLAAAPALEFKLDPSPDWTEDLVESLAATDAVRVLDLKAQYEDPEVRTRPTAAFYERLLEAFPDAIYEDPGLTPETSPVVETVRDQVSWDVPIHGVEDAESLPWQPSWLNVKPSRFGTLESLLDFLDWAAREDVSLYGGGQFELGVGRSQVQELAALFYPDGPNDVAPRAYNEPGVPENPPTPPIEVPGDRVGFGWRDA